MDKSEFKEVKTSPSPDVEIPLSTKGSVQKTDDIQETTFKSKSRRKTIIWVVGMCGHNTFKYLI